MISCGTVLLSLLLCSCQVVVDAFNDWNYWPSTGRGPEAWGFFSGFQQCRIGRRQSPIDIDPEQLLFDPFLRTPLEISKTTAPLIITNTGLDVTLRVNDPNAQIRITGGPLVYEYEFYEAHLHWGSSDTSGSEHAIAGRLFPAELQLIGYNVFFGNFSNAISHPFGVVAISILLRLGEDEKEVSAEVGQIMDKMEDIQYKDTQTVILDFSIANLLPNTSFYMTYEGSLTRPPCAESVVWIISNRPQAVSSKHLEFLRQLKATRELAGVHVPLIDNFRPIRQTSSGGSPTETVPIRTNINFSHEQQNKCPTRRYIGYKANN